MLIHWLTPEQTVAELTFEGIARGYLLRMQGKAILYPQHDWTVEMFNWLKEELLRFSSHQTLHCFLTYLPNRLQCEQYRSAGFTCRTLKHWEILIYQENAIRFEIFTPLHIDLILEWFTYEHVKQYYAVHVYTQQEIKERFISQCQFPMIQAFIVFYQDRPIGYVQYSPLKLFPWPNQDLPDYVVEKTAALEMFLGPPDTLSQGLGSIMLQAFLKQSVWKKYDYAIVDPWIENTSGMRFYERNGFQYHKKIEARFTDKPTVWTQLMIVSRHSFEGLELMGSQWWMRSIRSSDEGSIQDWILSFKDTPIEAQRIFPEWFHIEQEKSISLKIVIDNNKKVLGILCFYITPCHSKCVIQYLFLKNKEYEKNEVIKKSFQYIKYQFESILIEDKDLSLEKNK